MNEKSKTFRTDKFKYLLVKRSRLRICTSKYADAARRVKRTCIYEYLRTSSTYIPTIERDGATLQRRYTLEWERRR